MKTILEVLIERDNMPKDEAEDLINEAKEEVQTILDRDGGLWEVEEILMDYFGLEPDYIFDLIDL